MAASRDAKIYLHANTTLFQSLVHLLAAASFFARAHYLRLNEPFYLFWYYFYISFGVLLSIAIVLQVLNGFKFRRLAAILNILVGVVLVVESLAKITESTKFFYFLNFLGGLFFLVAGLLDDRIREIPYIAFNRQRIYGRNLSFISFQYYWQDIADISFRNSRLKITMVDGMEIQFRIARQSKGGIMFKSAEYLCQQILMEKSKAKA